MGRYLWNKRSPEALSESLVYFKKAIEVDPTYARAYLGLSDYYEVLPGVTGVSAREATANAEAAATKALELDPALGEAYATLASIASSRWQWEEAGKKFRHAIALVPNYATAHQWYAEYLQVIGNLKESETEFSKARELDPLSVVIAAGIAQQSYFERHYEAALTQYGKVLQMDPSFPAIHLHVGLVQLAMGKLTEATEEFRKDAADPNNLGAASLLACVQAISGHVSEARAILQQLESRRGQQRVPASSLALIHMGLDDKDVTFAHLNRAIEEHDFLMRWIKSSPFFDPLRSDPRYTFLLERMNLRTN
jgi:Tfp pilus assembly protein PilF